jgi:hypothetical protein
MYEIFRLQVSHTPQPQLTTPVPMPTLTTTFLTLYSQVYRFAQYYLFPCRLACTYKKYDTGIPYPICLSLGIPIYHPILGK